MFNKLQDVLASYKSDISLPNSGENVADLVAKVTEAFEGSAVITTRPMDLGRGVVIEHELPESAIPLTLVVLRVRGNLADVCAMTYVYEMATELDLIIKFHGCLRDTWAMQGDIVASVPLASLHDWTIVGQVDDDDVQTMLDFISDEISVLPSSKKGAGSFLPVKREFKELEHARYRNVLSAAAMAPVD